MCGFDGNDKELKGIFIEQFNNLKNLLPVFSWEPAEQAEPASVAGKVLAVVEDKKRFYRHLHAEGIRCTAKRAAPHSFPETPYIERN